MSSCDQYTPKTALRNAIYYAVRPFLPRWFQIRLRRNLIKKIASRCKDIWPIYDQAATPPPNWQGWPNGKKFAFALMHDVDTQYGHDNLRRLMDLEEKYGLRSLFSFVPERYQLSQDLLREVKERGFEVGIHGLKHDGKLFANYRTFKKRAKKINQYIQKWQIEGFSSPAMHHNLQWMHELNVAYAVSTFDTDPFEPQPDGTHTIFPFFVANEVSGKNYLELPYTLPQDHTLFILLLEQGIDIWRKKLDWIAQKGGMALVNVHPDYCSFEDCLDTNRAYPATRYEKFLRYAAETYSTMYWHALPKDIAHFWRFRNKTEETPQTMKPVQD